MIQPARVLLSNAPPLDSDSSHASRVLQEHSGNRQLNDDSYANAIDDKYPSTLLAENNYPVHQPVHGPQHVYRQTLQQKHGYRYGHSRHLGVQSDQVRNAKIARFLYHRFRASDQFMKYRHRQQTPDKKSQEQKWPDHLERAFIQALVQWPPMGRRQLPHKDKQRGRNELIADYIEELTNETRTRKQVSSHIQVLTPFVKHDTFIMKWLSRDDITGARLEQLYAGQGSSVYDRRASNYAVAAADNAARPAVPMMSQTEVDNLSKVKSLLEVFEPTDFSMFVQRKFSEDEVDRLHTYTKSIANPLQEDRQLPDWQTLEQSFPLLHSLHQHRPLDCNVLLAEASLALTTDIFKDKDGAGLPGVELGISFLCRSRHLPANAHVRCQNNFYRDGNLLREHSAQIDVQLTQADDGMGVEMQLKFGSTFWAKTLAFLASKLNSTAVDAAKSPTEEISEHINSITASQEIVLRTVTGVERLLVIYWKFRLSSGDRGRAYWMRLLLPPSSEHSEPRDERVDSVYDYGLLNYSDDTPAHQLHAAQPALQSPFEYDSNPGSALPSATWPSNMDDGSTDTAPQSAIDWNGDNNSFDFTGGNVHIPYDPNLDFSTFDSTAYNFDAAVDFAADPALQDYSQQAQDYSQQSQDYPHHSQEYDSQPQDFPQHTDYPAEWCDGYTIAYDSQQSVTGASSSYPVLPTDSQSQVYDHFPQYDQSYGVRAEAQAYGGAGQDGAKNEDPLGYMPSNHGLPLHEHQT